jgi:hypothetical protein
MLRKGLAGAVESGESSVSGDMLKSIPDQRAQRFDHYELVTGEDGKPVELGRGAMGVTYKAFDVDLRCPVTLKVISETPETPAFTSLSGYDGLTTGHGVIVRLDCTRNLRLLTHEFVHVAQYERLGREGFPSRIHSTNRFTQIPGCPFRVRGGSQGY